MEKVNIIIIMIISPSLTEPPPITNTEMETAAGRSGPTCATHSAVKMRPNFSAAHFVDVISSSIHHFPVESALPGRYIRIHRTLHFSHPAVCVRAVLS